MSVRFKNQRILHNLLDHPVHPTMTDVLYWFSKRFYDVVITSAYREGDTGIHGYLPLRAVDVRSTIYSNPALVAEETNRYWDYDPKRPGRYQVAFLHDVGRGIHLHLQVHPRTVRR